MSELSKKMIAPISLSLASIGCVVRNGDALLKVSHSYSGCNGCVFNTEYGARFCQFSSFCFAHLRRDKLSVKFVKI